MEKEQAKTKEVTKKGLTPRQLFWTRFALWVLFALVAPVAFIAWRFELFKGNHVSISGWGFLAIVIIAVFIISLLRYVKKGLPFSFMSQCISGLCKVILPLVCLYAILYCIQQNLQAFLQALGCVILCELVAIPLNPMPQWMHDNLEEKDREKIESMSDIIWDKFFSRKDKEE